MAKKRNKHFVWEYRKYFATNQLPSILVETDNHKKKEFYEELEYLVRLLHQDGIKYINYNHITWIIPKAPLPLKWKGEHFCLSYLNDRGHLVLIYLKVINRNKLSKYLRELEWLKQK